MSTLRDPFGSGAWILADPFAITVTNAAGTGSWALPLEVTFAGAGVVAVRPTIVGAGSWQVQLAVDFEGATEVFAAAGYGHRPAHHAPRPHQPPGHAPSGAALDPGDPVDPPPPPPSVRGGSRSVDWATIVYAARTGVERQYPSYEFSNGRAFYQPEDFEL